MAEEEAGAFIIHSLPLHTLKPDIVSVSAAWRTVLPIYNNFRLDRPCANVPPLLTTRKLLLSCRVVYYHCQYRQPVYIDSTISSCASIDMSHKTKHYFSCNPVMQSLNEFNRVTGECKLIVCLKRLLFRSNCFLHEI